MPYNIPNIDIVFYNSRIDGYRRGHYKCILTCDFNNNFLKYLDICVNGWQNYDAEKEYKLNTILSEPL
jgi:hypothetical protein